MHGSGGLNEFPRPSGSEVVCHEQNDTGLITGHSGLDYTKLQLRNTVTLTPDNHVLRLAHKIYQPSLTPPG